MNRYGLILLAALAGISQAAMAQDVARLGQDLVPSGGGERAGNKDGTIPAWEGAPAPDNWTYGKVRFDSWKYRADKPLFSIDASNVDKYADKLSPGQIATIKQIKNYRMDVYPSHRDCGIPDFVAENTKKNVGFATLDANGWSLKEAYVPGFPFPFAANGAEAMWNMKMRYHGVGVNYPHIVTSVSPRKGSTEWIRAAQDLTFFYPWGNKGSTKLSTLPPIEYDGYFAYTSPPALAGQALVITVYLNQPGAETNYYFPGQRRVRRMPTYSYDSPQIGMEDQYTLDEPTVFNGTIDRFDWKIVGKKEMYVAYNSFGAYDYKAKLETVEQPDFVNPASRHYELHRVWVLEATVKKGMRHIAPKRFYYLDEDSWNVMAGEDYDAQGKLFKYREGYLIPVYETGTCDVLAFAQYNLSEGRYVFDMDPVGGTKDMQWVTVPNGPRFKQDFYTADNLRAISAR